MGEGMKRAFAAAAATRMKAYVFTTTTGRQFQVSGETLKDAKRRALGHLNKDEGVKHIEKLK